MESIVINITCFVAGLIIGLFVIFFIKKPIVKQSEIESEIIPDVKVEEKPKPKKRKALMQVTVINNKTDKEYILESQNDFGLTWDYTNSTKERTFDLLKVNQKHSINNEDDVWTAVGRFVDFSVKGTVFQEFDIIYDEEKKEA